MKLAGFLLLLAGWGLVYAALRLLGPVPARAGFVLAAIGVQIVGLILVVRSHRVLGRAKG